MEKNAVIQVGGSIEQALKGEYNIDVKAVLSEGWALTQQSRISINLGLIFCLFLSGALMMAVASYFGEVKAIIENSQANFALNILITLLVSPFLVGVEMMGIFHAVGAKTQPKLVFAFLKHGSFVAICALLSSTFISLGLNLFILPGLYLLVALSLALPLVVDKKLSPLKAIIISLQVTRFQWLSIFLVYAGLFFILIILFMPMVLLAESSASIVGGVMFFIGISYLAPMFYNVKGILYREIFGMQLTIKNGSDNGKGDDVTPSDTFSA